MEEDIHAGTLTDNLALSSNPWSISNPKSLPIRKNLRLLLEFFFRKWKRKFYT